MFADNLIGMQVKSVLCDTLSCFMFYVKPFMSPQMSPINTILKGFIIYIIERIFCTKYYQIKGIMKLVSFFTDIRYKFRYYV